MTFTKSRGADGVVPARFATAFQRGTLSCKAERRIAAIETERIAFAPRRDLFGVPSSLMRKVSSSSSELKSRPITASAISLFTFSIARVTLPSASRSSTASCVPVLSPDGTDAVALNSPHVSVVSTVGRPRVSGVARAVILSIFILAAKFFFKLGNLLNGLYNRVRVERHAFYSFFNKKLCEVWEIRRSLPTNAEILSAASTGTDNFTDERAHSLVILICNARHDSRV